MSSVPLSPRSFPGRLACLRVVPVCSTVLVDTFNPRPIVSNDVPSVFGRRNLWLLLVDDAVRIIPNIRLCRQVATQVNLFPKR